MISTSGETFFACPTATTACEETLPRSCADGQAARGCGPAQRGLGMDDPVHGLRVRREALDLPAARGRERLAEVEQRRGAEDIAAADRDEHSEHGPDDEAGDRQPPARRDPRPGRAKVDLPLGVGIGRSASRSSRRDPSSGPLPLGRESLAQATSSAPSRAHCESATCRLSSAAGRPAPPGGRGCRGPACELLEDRDRVAHRCLFAAAEVVGAAATVHRRDRSLHEVADVREAPRLEPVAEQVERPPSASAIAIRVNAMSGRCRGPYALK